jgi:nickel/cobalt transporter (NicO) family protein
MEEQSLILFITAASIAFIHTLLGPDHYIPFISMAKTGAWSRKKTFLVTVLSGLGHVFSSVLIGLMGITAGIAIERVESIETFRADLAAWLIISFGLIYFIWGIKKAYLKKSHVCHQDSGVHKHSHSHPGNLTPWIIFTIFILGPCEPLIPLLIYPSVMESVFTLVMVILIFTTVTTSTMLAVVAAGLYGIKFLPVKHFETYSHAIAGLLILFCGISIKFMGL